MTIQVLGDTPGFATSPASGITATLYRFELVGGALVRSRPGDASPCSEADRYLIDVLLNEDETGRYLNGVRGFVVPRRGRVCTDPAQDLQRRRTFKVGVDIMLAIGKSLSVGSQMRPVPRLATLDGRRVD